MCSVWQIAYNVANGKFSRGKMIDKVYDSCEKFGLNNQKINDVFS